MNILLKKLSLKNFKGVKELSLDFEKITNITGENGTGKTTIFDGFLWLLFGKDSQGKSAFEVQPLDSQGNVLHGLETNVTAILDVDGYERTFSRTLSEKWVKQRGQAEAELKGTQTTFEVDRIPTKLKDYQATINSIVNEDLFKMVTNPLYFPSIKWQDQRKILLEITGEPEEENIISYNPSLSPLKDEMQDGIDNFVKRTKASIGKLKDQLKSIPFRIDECNNSIAEVDTTILEFQKRSVVSGIERLEEQIVDSSKVNEEKLKLQDKLFELKDKQNELATKAVQEAQKPLMDIKNKIAEIESKVKIKVISVADMEANVKRLQNSNDLLDNEMNAKRDKQQELREKWVEINKNVFEFDETQTVCPCCGRPYEIEKIAEIKKNTEITFVVDKKKQLDSITADGKKLGDEIAELVKQINRNVSKITECRCNISEIEKEIEGEKAELLDLEKQKESFNNATELVIPGMEEIVKEIALVEADMKAFGTTDNSILKEKKKELQEQLEGINKQLNAKDNNAKLLARIEELKAEEKKLNVKIADLEGRLYLGEEFIRTKVELLESSINEKFGGAVTFKLFNNQVNGGLSECCEAMVDGVPFSNVNTAGRINAGLSIIKTLSKHYGVQAPIFIDNRESINNIVDFKGQIINLKVGKNKKLKIESEE
jgi:DNA repair exonuclease SbcCD ATPase subunit|nr:MAG TPA: chromosome partition protein [Caudoviricetes sp.]